jgi:hypothetical protein
MRFQRNISLLLGRMEPHQRVEFHPCRRELRKGEFRCGYDELGRRARDVRGRAPLGYRELHTGELHIRPR